ncbi:hypothetical protein AAHB33_01700 [Paenarthrobacter sp. S56]
MSFNTSCGFGPVAYRQVGPLTGIQSVQPGLVMALGASFQITGVPSA